MICINKFIDNATPDVKYIKAINTIIKIDGKVKVYNTDWVAIYNLITQKLGKIHHIDNSNKINKILIIGTGGTSLAAIFAVLKMGSIPIIYNRETNIVKNMKFMNDLWKQNSKPQYCYDLSMLNYTNNFEPFSSLIKEEDIEGIKALSESIKQGHRAETGVDAVISWIPGVVGFSIPEDVADVVLGTDTNESTKVVLDASYIPKETELLKQALKYNCEIITGVEMLIDQAWEQAKIFTGKGIFSDSCVSTVNSAVYTYYNSIT